MVPTDCPSSCMTQGPCIILGFMHLPTDWISSCFCHPLWILDTVLLPWTSTFASHWPSSILTIQLWSLLIKLMPMQSLRLCLVLTISQSCLSCQADAQQCGCDHTCSLNLMTVQLFLLETIPLPRMTTSNTHWPPNHLRSDHLTNQIDLALSPNAIPSHIAFTKFKGTVLPGVQHDKITFGTKWLSNNVPSVPLWSPLSSWSPKTSVPTNCLAIW